MGGLLLAPRPVEAQAPTAAPAAPAAPGTPAAPGAPSAATGSSAPQADLSPKIAGGDHDAAAAGADSGRDRDTGDDPTGGDTAVLAPDAAALFALGEELGIGQLVPSADPVARGPAGSESAGPTEEAFGDTGGNPDAAAPLVAGTLVSLVILAGGGGFLWWRNRDSRYWAA